MYKLFLTFRYLTRKKIVLFPILVVWLCVMMLIIVTSIMGGFVDRVREANRDLFGDIIVSAEQSSLGFAGYDALRAALKEKFPEIQASTPVVEAFSLLYVPSAQRSVPALLVGVNPAERSQVTRFRESLFAQHEAPTRAVDALARRLPATRDQLVQFATDGVRAAALEQDAAVKAMDALRSDYLQQAEAARKQGLPFTGYQAAPDYRWAAGLVPLALVMGLLIWRERRGAWVTPDGTRMTTFRSAWSWVTLSATLAVGLTVVGLGMAWPVVFPRKFDLAEDRYHRSELALADAQRTVDLAESLREGTYKTRQDLATALVPAVPTFTPPAEAKNDLAGAPLPAEGCIVGSQIGFLRRDTRGNFVHYYPQRFLKVQVTVFKPSSNGTIDTNFGAGPASIGLTIIDDSHSGVYDVDSLNVYAPLETVQMMAGMRADPELVKVDPTLNFDPRCHQLLIRLKPEAQSQMKVLRAQMSEFVQNYISTAALDHPGWFPSDLLVQTWDEKQARYLGAVQNEKKMMTFILGLMSMVVLVVIFLIFYQIVRDKTRDIGIIKAVGGSEEGVAGIFLTYGLFIGLVGGGLGILTGVLFVTHTNEIHEWIYQVTGLIIWDRSVYLFDRIPDKVYLSDVITYYAVALAAGVVGALIPAIVAGSQDPVQAVRYE
jgi:ABC-type lipoprotein release transport system permease subunit